MSLSVVPGDKLATGPHDHRVGDATEETTMMTTEGTSEHEAMGTLAWGRRTGGVLADKEARVELRNAVFVRIRDRLDRIRRAVGLLRPVDVSFDELTPPDSAFATDALRFAEETHERPLLFHSWRSYYFGALIAKYDGMAFDSELFFAAAILHDVGLTKAAAAPISRCCFAFAGGLQAYEYLVAKGHDRLRARSVGDAISLHMNLAVSARDHGPEAFMVARGAVCDAFGAGLPRMSRRSVEQTVTRYPRAGVRQHLFFPDHMAGTRPALLTRLVKGKIPEHPLDTPDRS
jgi:hypothetical protein